MAMSGAVSSHVIPFMPPAPRREMERSDAEADRTVAHRHASYRRSMLGHMPLLCEIRNAIARIGSDVQAAAAVWIYQSRTYMRLRRKTHAVSFGGRHAK